MPKDHTATNFIEKMSCYPEVILTELPGRIQVNESTGKVRIVVGTSDKTQATTPPVFSPSKLDFCYSWRRL